MTRAHGLRDLAADLGITERSACAIVADLAQAGYVIKQKDGRRNRYQVEAHLPLPEPGARDPASHSEVLALLLGNTGGRDRPPGPAAVGWPGGVDGPGPDFAGAAGPGSVDDRPAARGRLPSAAGSIRVWSAWRTAS